MRLEDLESMNLSLLDRIEIINQYPQRIVRTMGYFRNIEKRKVGEDEVSVLTYYHNSGSRNLIFERCFDKPIDEIHSVTILVPGEETPVS